MVFLVDAGGIMGVLLAAGVMIGCLVGTIVGIHRGIQNWKKRK